MNPRGIIAYFCEEIPDRVSTKATGTIGWRACGTSHEAQLPQGIYIDLAAVVVICYAVTAAFLIARASAISAQPQA